MIVVIGGGAVGLSAAYALARRGREVCVIERHRKFGQETSTHNSGVIHAGLYYPAGSLKARLCVDGRDRLYAFAADAGIPHARTGKLIVAQPGEDEALDRLVSNAAANGVALSAFGFQGQKCSACSRAIVSEKVYEPFLEKLKAEVAKLSVDEPEKHGVYMGPVVNAAARDKILSYIETGRKEGRVVAGGGPVAGKDGYFIQPTVIADVKPNARIAQEEIFGPVLAVIPVKSYDEALEVANGTDYGLTGAVYTKNPQKIERARREFFVGNLYINRKCTGAIVGAQPFGGFNMSGTDSKAGGRDYLLLFLQAKSVAEKVG